MGLRVAVKPRKRHEDICLRRGTALGVLQCRQRRYVRAEGFIRSQEHAKNDGFGVSKGASTPKVGGPRTRVLMTLHGFHDFSPFRNGHPSPYYTTSSSTSTPDVTTQIVSLDFLRRLRAERMYSQRPTSPPSPWADRLIPHLVSERLMRSSLRHLIPVIQVEV